LPRRENPFAGAGPDLNASQFYITTGDDLHSLDEKHTIFGEVAEGWDVLEAINETPCDDAGRPLQNIRYVLRCIALKTLNPQPSTLPLASLLSMITALCTTMMGRNTFIMIFTVFTDEN